MNQRMSDVFIVPGVPATRIVLPFGMPPPSARSRPSTYVSRRGTSTSIASARRGPRYKALASSLSREIFTGEKYGIRGPRGKECFCRPGPLRSAREGMGKRDEAALKLLRWELEGHGKIVMQAMLRHPDKSLADAVELIEQEIPALSAHDGSPEIPMPQAPRPRASTELDALSQEFQTFRHLLHPREAKEFEAALRELARTQDRDGLAALRRRLRSLSLQAAFWSDLARDKESNALALVILRRGRDVLAKAGATAYLHLPVGRLVVMTGEDTSIAALFRRAPGKDVVAVLVKTVEAIEENRAAATKT